jgi:acyl-CoA thioester hydrolase
VGVSVEQVERLRVAWVDTDAGGRIHFSNAFRWAEVAETSLMRRLGMLEGWGDYPRKHAEAEFHRVLRFEDELDVRLGVEQVGRTSITYSWTLEREGEVCVSGRHTVVSVDRDGRPAPLSEEVRAALSG